MELDESLFLCIATGNFVCVLVCYALQGECVLPVCFVTCSDPVGGVLTLLERLFGVKGYDCCLLCLAFGKLCP